MKKFLLYIVILLLLPVVVSSCGNSGEDEKDEPKNYWVEYANWREENIAFFEEKYAEVDENGNLVYERVTPSWDASSTILMRWYNDRSLTANNMTPFLTSYVDVVYKGTTYQDTVFDSSYNNTIYGDSIYRSKLSNNITGWVIGLMNMHVGDHCQLIIPYDCAYGNTYKSDIILPYSTLVFDVELRAIPGLEKPVRSKVIE